MYSKLMSSILASSIWSEDSDTCKVWITLVALQDREGFVFGTVPGIARFAALPIETVSTAIEKFLNPDPFSSDLGREPERQGRRIEIVDGGWKLLNGRFYRDLHDADERRMKDAERKRIQRTRHALSRDVTKSPPSEAESEEESKEEREKGASPPTPSRFRLKFTPPTREECGVWFTERGQQKEGDRFFAFYESNGWRVGKNPMKKWKMAAASWLLRRDQP